MSAVGAQATLDSTGRKVAPVYLVFNGEVTLRAPVKVVWRHLINYQSWQSYSVRQHICGEIGREGEVVLLKKEEKGYSSPPYYARTVKIDPERRIIWKTYRDQAPGDEGYFGFVDFRLSEVDGGTLFASSNIYEFMVPFAEETELEAFRAKRQEISEGVFAATRAKLKSLVEATASTAR